MAYPAIGGLIRSREGIEQAELKVTGAILDRTTTVLVQEWAAAGSFVAARIVLSEQDRIELIELLGGTATP